MERNAKRILAIVIIAAIATAGIVGAIFLLQGGTTSYYTTPGVTGVPDSRLIKVGVIGPMTDIQGENEWNGAWLKAYEINQAGGVDINGTTYYVGITKEDTKESATEPSDDVAKAAVNRLLNIKKAEYIVGGFRTESVQSYMKNVMDAKKLFLGTGSADYSLCALVDIPAAGVTANPNMAKYFFRLMPHNSIDLAYDILNFMKYLCLGGINATAYTSYNGTAGYGDLESAGGMAISNVVVAYEPYTWTAGMVAFLNAALNATLTAYGHPLSVYQPYQLSSTADWQTQMSDIMAYKPQIVIPILSAAMSAPFLAAYQGIASGSARPLLAGIDVASSMSTYWTTVNGDCDLEIFTGSSAGLNTSVTALSQPFCTAYAERFGYWPLYTATGAYDAVAVICEAIKESGGQMDSDALVAQMETWTKADPLVNKTAASPSLAWFDGRYHTNMHEVATNDLTLGETAFYSSFIGQWQDEEMKCIYAGAFGVSNPTLLTGVLQLPTAGMYGTPAHPL
ncbi:MAG: ABC transporter substrate-binding protein [Candidatus Lokiarchaeota archaeon]|nr:ABC transporter substrate-binding protein [Candidatus Lokiarchaeota archaeon]